MRTIERAAAFKRDFKRIQKTPRYARDIDLLLLSVLSRFMDGCVLPSHFRDHALTGPWGGYRECHLKPDLLLIYKITDTAIFLARLGSHSELFK